MSTNHVLNPSLSHQSGLRSNRKTLNMKHKIDSLPLDVLNKLKDKQRQHEKDRHHLQSKKQIIDRFSQYEDFLSMMFIHASFEKLITISKILIQIINLHEEGKNDIHQQISYCETIFSTYTPIKVIEDGKSFYVSFKMYYNSIVNESVSFITSSSIEKDENFNERCNHLKNLLRACFIIGFTCDIRLKRFVMARHKIHYEIMKTKPPNRTKSISFINESKTRFVKPFLSQQDDIIIMVKSCVELWINQYVIHK
jgi:hypothetical protein